MRGRSRLSSLFILRFRVPPDRIIVDMPEFAEAAKVIQVHDSLAGAHLAAVSILLRIVGLPNFATDC
jgi:hypothetical protein